ncbi:MAG: winged helix-turn-helix transcriptional regulator [Anaerolineales bacterium]|nr:winged helix-turn-helix transcriptional regulator [Anaerolineales bacterium]
MAQIDEMRLVTRVACMYYEWDMKQSAIARQLGLSQPTISRLLQQAKEEGIIRISVSVPQGIYTELEEQLVKQYRLRDAIVVDCSGEGDERFIERQIGAAAAYYLESALRPNEVVGISSWSATLLALVDAMHAAPRKGDVRVVQILGGVGSPSAEAHAGRLTSRLADLLSGAAIFLPAPGIVGSEGAMQAITADHYVRGALNLRPCYHRVGGDRCDRTVEIACRQRESLLSFGTGRSEAGRRSGRRVVALL